jgi:hypothetical protein
MMKLSAGRFTGKRQLQHNKDDSTLPSYSNLSTTAVNLVYAGVTKPRVVEQNLYAFIKMSVNEVGQDVITKNCYQKHA